LSKGNFECLTVSQGIGCLVQLILLQHQLGGKTSTLEKVERWRRRTKRCLHAPGSFQVADK
jgi:hypothetical protein